MKIGVIAEDVSDVEVLYELTCKLIRENSFSFNKFVGHGGGTLRRKCAAWAKNLFLQGCTHLVVLHDLDDKNENELRSELVGYVRNIRYVGCIILIPVREIEAWLLVDDKAIKQVFSMSKRPKLPRKPEEIMHPKKKLRDIVWKETKKRYVNTIHNRKIANASRITRLRTCRSFRPYPVFIKSHTSI